MKENKIFLAKVTDGTEIIPILVYRKGIYIREYETNRILYNIKTKDSTISTLFGDKYVMVPYKNPKNKEEYEDGYIYVNSETIDSYKESFKSSKQSNLKKALSKTPLENEIFRVKLNFVEEFDQVDNDENDLETILKSRTKTQDSISILVYFENGVAKELITGRTITYIKQKTEKIDAGRKIIEQNVVPGESESVFFEISDDYPLYIPHDEDIEKYKAPASLGNMNLDLTYIFSLGKEKIKKPLGGKQKK